MKRTPDLYRKARRPKAIRDRAFEAFERGRREHLRRQVLDPRSLTSQAADLFAAWAKTEVAAGMQHAALRRAHAQIEPWLLAIHRRDRKRRNRFRVWWRRHGKSFDGVACHECAVAVPTFAEHRANDHGFVALPPLLGIPVLQAENAESGVRRGTIEQGGGADHGDPLFRGAMLIRGPSVPWEVMPTFVDGDDTTAEEMKARILDRMRKTEDDVFLHGNPPAGSVTLIDGHKPKVIGATSRDTAES